MEHLINKTNKAINSKNELKTSIDNKGIYMDTDVMSEFPNKINRIPFKRDAQFLVKKAPARFSIGSYVKELILPEDMSNIRNVYSAFQSYEALESLEFPESAINLSSVVNTFQYCINITKVKFPTKANNIISLNSTFYGCSKLTEIIFPDNLTTVSDIRNCFYNCSLLNITNIDFIKNPDSIILMDNIFLGCRSITEINLPITMNRVESIYGIFDNSGIRRITLPEMPNLTNMAYSLSNCSSLTYVELPINLNASSAYSMFRNDTSLIYTNIYEVNFSNLTHASGMFYRCLSMTRITLPENMVNIENCYGIVSTDYDGGNLTYFKFPSKANNIADLSYAFRGCKSLITIEFPEDLSKVKNIPQCFNWSNNIENISGVKILPKIQLNNWNLNNHTKLTVDSLNTIISALQDITNDVDEQGNPLVLTCTLGATNLAKLTEEQIAVGTDKGWTLN